MMQTNGKQIREERPTVKDPRTAQPGETTRRASAPSPAEGGSSEPNWGAVALGGLLAGLPGAALAYYATNSSSGGANTTQAPPPAPAGPAPTATVTAPALVTLGSEMSLTAGVAGATATAYTFEVKRASEAVWLPLGGGQAATLRTVARVPGNLQVRVRARTQAAEATSAATAVQVQFMALATVKADPTCVGWFNAAWTATKAATSDGSRREQGFWIRYNSANSTYEKAGETVGTPVDNSTGAVLNGFPSRPADAPAAPAANTNGVFTVAWYHTHTPTLYRVGGRGTGPSDGDLGWSSTHDTPGLAHDYTGDPAPQGHPIDSPVRLYDCVPPSRRGTPA
jgi:hypothetical protein